MKDSNIFLGEKKEPSCDEAFAKSIHLGYDGGLYVTEEDYLKYVKGNELHFGINLRYGYICVVREGAFKFCHYGPAGLKNIRPSTYEYNDNLTLCEGVYCFNAMLHEPVKCKDGIVLYYGTYKGKYAECVFDCDPDPGFDKDRGSTKEFVLLTKEPVNFDKVLDTSEIINRQ